jgi:predicted dehydrogenase
VTRRIRVGVVGCGLVAQTMHLHYLRELPELFEVGALCDVSAEALEFAGTMFPAARRHTSWPEMLEGELDAVLVLTAGSHEPIAVAAADAGLHAFVEKPMAYSVAEAELMIRAADRARVRLMLGYMKRYDPAYEQLASRLDLAQVRAARVTTLESPEVQYVAHYPLRRGEPEADVLAELRRDDERRIRAAIDTDDEVVRRAYHEVVLSSMVHELNATRGLLGEPTELRSAHVADTLITATVAFGHVECTFLWVALPAISRYEQELAFFAPGERLKLTFPSPFLRSAPTTLTIEGGEPDSPRSWQTTETVSFDEAFKRELREFHACIVEDREPRTTGLDGLRDVAFAQAIVRCHQSGLPVIAPTEPALEPVRDARAR